MKRKYINFIAILTLSVVLFSCKKDDFVSTKDQVGISKVTNYAVFNLTNVTVVNGVNYTLVAKGAAYSEPGVKALSGGAELPVKTSGSVNTATPGVYVITYSAVNADGFNASAQRFVVVYATDASATANDFSGTYVRSSNGQTAVWTKLAPGVYSVFNPGGAIGVGLAVVVFNATGSAIKIPQQAANDGSITSSDLEASTPGPGGTLAAYEWKIVNAGYGPAVRKFVKQ